MTLSLGPTLVVNETGGERRRENVTHSCNNVTPRDINIIPSPSRSLTLVLSSAATAAGQTRARETRDERSISAAAQRHFLSLTHTCGGVRRASQSGEGSRACDRLQVDRRPMIECLLHHALQPEARRTLSLFLSREDRRVWPSPQDDCRRPR